VSPPLGTWFASLPLAGELVLVGSPADISLGDPLSWAWSAAEAEAVLAYEAWRESPSAEASAVYRAAAARADAAQDALAAFAALDGSDKPRRIGA
jgi:hypothetical protein